MLHITQFRSPKRWVCAGGYFVRK